MEITSELCADCLRQNLEIIASSLGLLHFTLGFVFIIIHGSKAKQTMAWPHLSQDGQEMDKRWTEVGGWRGRLGPTLNNTLDFMVQALVGVQTFARLRQLHLTSNKLAFM